MSYTLVDMFSKDSFKLFSTTSTPRAEYFTNSKPSEPSIPVLRKLDLTVFTVPAISSARLFEERILYSIQSLRGGNVPPPIFSIPLTNEVPVDSATFPMPVLVIRSNPGKPILTVYSLPLARLVKLTGNSLLKPLAKGLTTKSLVTPITFPPTFMPKPPTLANAPGAFTIAPATSGASTANIDFCFKRFKL